MSEVVLQARDLRVAARGRASAVWPVDGVSFEVRGGECFGLAGESGAGKSLTLRAVIGLLPPSTSLARGTVLLRGEPYHARSRAQRMGMVFQEPKTSLNPLMRAGEMIREGLRVHGVRGAHAKRSAIALLQEVGIEDPELRLRSFPHQLSGGQRQRVAIAMALAAEPAVLLCDEPTTALDVPVQERILQLLDRLRIERGLAIVFVSHDLAVIGRIAQRIGVMYAGRILECGPATEVLARPCHPYTERLLASLPRIDAGMPARGILGEPPSPGRWPSGCRFHPRCAHAKPDCSQAPYVLMDCGPDRQSACIYWRELELTAQRECA
ncbi:MAG TPA: ABC transporter ATP-binding protein [Solirubrobacteraceae bacterium]